MRTLHNSFDLRVIRMGVDMIDIEEQDVMARALIRTARRERICRNAISCKKCGTDQVHLIDAGTPAEWKCRHCKHKFIHEPIFNATT